MSVFKRDKGRALSSSEFPRMSSSKGLGKVSHSGSSGSSQISKARISDSIRRHRAGAASTSTTVRTSKPRRRWIDGVNQARLARIITVIAFVAVGTTGLVLILLSANSGTRELEMSVIDNADSSSVITPEDTDSSITIALGGGIKLQDEIITAAKSGDSYNFDNYLSELEPIMTADISMVGLIGSVDGSGDNSAIAGYPSPNYPAQLIGALTNIGVTHAATANRSALTLGYDSMARTVSNLSANGITPLGTYTSAATGSTVYVKKIKSISVGIGAYSCMTSDDYEDTQTAQTNAGVTGEQLSYCINQLSYSKSREQNDKSYSEASDVITADVQAMREAGAQFIILYLDWGQAGTGSLPGEMTSLAQRLIDVGVDVTVGYGIDSPLKVTVKEYTGSEGAKKDCYMFYSLGNLFSDTGDSAIEKRESFVVRLELTRTAGEDKVSVKSPTYNPIYISRDSQYETENTHLKYRVIPAALYNDASDLPAVFSSNDEWTRCKKAYKSIKEIVNTTQNAAAKLMMGVVRSENTGAAVVGGDNSNI